MNATITQALKGARVASDHILIGILLFTSSFFLLPNRALADEDGVSLATKVFTTLLESAPTVQTDIEIQDDYMLIQLEYLDEMYPLTIDILTSLTEEPESVMFMLPASGTNFRANFFSPSDHNLAQFLRERDYFVVGITPREDAVPVMASYEFMKTWGVRKHSEDVRKIVNHVVRATDMSYEMLAYSFNAFTALDYAATYDDEDFERVIVIDIYNIAPYKHDDVAKAERLYQGYVQLMQNGIYVDASLGVLNDLVLGALYFPNADSGIPRAFLLAPEIAADYPGNFTAGGLAHYWFINTHRLPGVHTPITGLPNDWPLLHSTLAGNYTLAPDPLSDVYSFYHTPLISLLAVSQEFNTALIPLAMVRDIAAASAYNGAFSIDWENIETEVLWINSELGYGNLAYPVTLIDDVTFEITAGYGNADPMFSLTADRDVWSLITEDDED